MILMMITGYGNGKKGSHAEVADLFNDIRDDIYLKHYTAVKLFEMVCMIYLRIFGKHN